uniref:Uncharacterized protein n=1 Tax=Octopus bimaculoides TaxID=37653 RepID=A0A0L8GJP2_OCTBM
MSQWTIEDNSKSRLFNQLSGSSPYSYNQLPSSFKQYGHFHRQLKASLHAYPDPQ